MGHGFRAVSGPLLRLFGAVRLPYGTCACPLPQRRANELNHGNSLDGLGQTLAINPGRRGDADTAVSTMSRHGRRTTGGRVSRCLCMTTITMRTEAPLFAFPSWTASGSARDRRGKTGVFEKNLSRRLFRAQFDGWIKKLLDFCVNNILCRPNAQYYI